MKWKLGILLVVVLGLMSSGCVFHGFSGHSISLSETIGAGGKITLSTEGPGILEMEVVSDIPVHVKLVSEGGEVLRDFGITQNVSTRLRVSSGRWYLVISNPGNETGTVSARLSVSS
ncbi:hypothetical protein [Thermococcus sp. MAR1]|uniref:hypothetical protein n=1 Tax=Thermococcus sp. MAR1 TaxID=1638263 RepID=UPI00143BEC9B|nr:hypothetical protein [Thermococcus sp. MAR1]NJE10981.1 hypothetical protein [Thermococcus sp. MAR1]